MINEYSEHRHQYMSPHRLHIYLFLAFLIVYLLSSCSTFTQPAQPIHDNLVELDDKLTVGQSFSPRYDGIIGISIYLSSETPSNGNISLKLSNNTREKKDIDAQSNLEINGILDSRFYEILFSPLPDSSNQDYLLELSYKGEGAVFVGTAHSATYLEGALYSDNTAQESQLTFQLLYDPYYLFLGLAKDIIGWFAFFAVSIFSFVIPGWALLVLLFPNWKTLTFVEKFSLAAGMGIPIYPLLYLWADISKLQLGAYFAWLIPFISLVIVLWKTIISPKNGKHKEQISPIFRLNVKNIGKNLNRLCQPENIGLSIIVALLLFTRLWPTRTLSAPMWGDSYQHTIISQLLVDNNGLFTSWLPYAELNTFTYHFGFHTLVANFHWLTGLPMHESVLWIGQILNFFAIISLYPVATRISCNKWAGVIAISIAGLFSHIPMVYINWGRYTQLTGLVVLIAAVYISWSMLASSSRSGGLITLTVLAFSGLALTHYRILIFAITFFALCGIFHLTRLNIRDLFIKGLFSALLTAVLFLPWFLRIFSGRVFEILSVQLSTPASDTAATAHYANFLGQFAEYLAPLIWFLLLLTFVWALFRREKGAILIGLWWLFNIMISNPQWLGLPGEGSITNFATLISIYIPAGVLIGSFGGWLLDRYSTRNRGDMNLTHSTYLLRSAPELILIALLLPAAVYAARIRINDVKPESFALVTRPDIRASEWITHNLPSETKILVNAFPAYGGYVVVGSDAGWWLPLIAHRPTNLPPINYGLEGDPSAGFRERTNSLVSLIQAKGLGDPGVINTLVDQGITHAYIGQRQGMVNNPGAPLLDKEVLSSNPSYQLIYHEDLVRIYAIMGYR